MKPELAVMMTVSVVYLSAVAWGFYDIQIAKKENPERVKKIKKSLKLIGLISVLHLIFFYLGFYVFH